MQTSSQAMGRVMPNRQLKGQIVGSLSTNTFAQEAHVETKKIRVTYMHGRFLSLLGCRSHTICGGAAKAVLAGTCTARQDGCVHFSAFLHDVS